VESGSFVVTILSRHTNNSQSIALPKVARLSSSLGSKYFIHAQTHEVDEGISMDTKGKTFRVLSYTFFDSQNPINLCFLDSYVLASPLIKGKEDSCSSLGQGLEAPVMGSLEVDLGCIFY